MARCRSVRPATNRAGFAPPRAFTRATTSAQIGRAPALADKIPRMMPEARVAQPVSEAEAIRLARELYGLEVSSCRLPGEYDDNFRLTARDRREFVLKVMHSARERSF